MSMINVIFTLSHDPLSEDQRAAFYNLGCDWVADIPEMPHQGLVMPIQAVVPNTQILEGVRQTLNAIDTRGQVEIVGVWNVEDGLFYDNAAYPFNLALYASLLQPAATEQEALTIQVNRFAGMSDRQLV